MDSGNKPAFMSDSEEKRSGPNKTEVTRLSIIIPVQNVAAYLPQCLDSFLSVHLQDCEILLAMGKSMDGSDEICTDYCRRFSCIRMLAQDGKGPSNARNCALRAAAGEYVLFADGDDFIDPKTFQMLLKGIWEGEYNADVIWTDFYRYFDTKMTYRRVGGIGGRKIRGLDALPEVIEARQCFWNIWRNLYRRAFLLEHEIFFHEDTKEDYGEDVVFVSNVLLERPDILFVDAPFYCYRIGNENSRMGVHSHVRIQETAAALSWSITAFRQCGERWANCLVDCLQYDYILNIALLREIFPAERAKARAVFAGYREILLPSGDRLVRAAARFIKIIGLDAMAWLLSLAKRIKRRREGRT